ncbi:MAG: hypothetical protein RLZZ591_2530 [Pseudomonadota bacterium]|jgi:hypothetical protein
MNEEARTLQVEAHDLARLLDLERRARHSGTDRELAFLLVNDTHELTPYRQAVLWSSTRGVLALSGLLQAEANAPYVQWLKRLMRSATAGAAPGPAGIKQLHAGAVPAEVAREWADWWPAEALYVPLPAGQAGAKANHETVALVLVRDEAWTDKDSTLLQEWLDAAGHVYWMQQRARRGAWRALGTGLKRALAGQPGRAWWKGPWWLWLAAVAGVLALPVPLSVLAPGELVPAHPMVVRAPLEGVVDVFHVKPNQDVRKGDPLFGFDEALIQSRTDVARQTLATAEVEYRQTSQQALSDPRVRPQMAVLVGKIEEKRAELNYLREQRKRSQVLAPQDGVVLIDDPNEWIGRPVSVGERILRIAAPTDVEVEAWLPLADAIALPDGAQVHLYLNADPVSPVDATLRYMAHDAVQRPDGSYAYRVRATLTQPTQHRVGLKGTAKLLGPDVALGYWLIRRPLAAARAYLGV